MSRIRSLAAAGVATLVALLVCPVPAFAVQGVSLAWNHCLPQGTGVQNKDFACNTNSGEHTLVGTFQLSSNMNQVSGVEIILQLASASAALPAWWNLRAIGGCRTALTVDGETDPADVACPDWSEGQMFVGLGTYCTSAGPCVDRPGPANEARIKLVEAVPQQLVKNLVPAQDYFSFNIRLTNVKTVGLDACAGCTTPVCIVFNSVNITTVQNLNNRFISTASSPGSNFVTWQGGGGTNCPAATPTRNATWGSLKSLYR